MAVVALWGNSKRETGQTLSAVSIGTTMAIEHNYKILIISTGFQDETMEECFWDKNKNTGLDFVKPQKIGINNGFEGLVKIIQSNRTSSNIIKDYAKVVFRDRLDILLSPQTNNFDDYNASAHYYKDIVKYADKEYDLVIIDVDKKMDVEAKKEILAQANAIMVTFKQSMESIETAKILREKNPDSRGNKIMFMVGKYDYNSKYNTKNLSRMLRENKEISAVPYNTLFYESTMEGKVADYFLKYRTTTDTSDDNYKFIAENKRTCDTIITKLQELQMRT